MLSGFRRPATESVGDFSQAYRRGQRLISLSGVRCSDLIDKAPAENEGSSELVPGERLNLLASGKTP